MQARFHAVFFMNGTDEPTWKGAVALLRLLPFETPGKLPRV